MAKKKRKVHHRRRRVSGVGRINVKSIGIKVLGTAAGAFAARLLYNMGLKQFPTIKPQYAGLGIVVVGALIPKFIKSELGSAAGDGMIAIGSLSALQGFGVISGVGQIPGRRVPSRVMSGGQFQNRVMSGGNRPYNRTTVGGQNRPFMRTTVGSMRAESMGALYDED